MKSLKPVLLGILLVVHLPTMAATGDVEDGTKVFAQAESLLMARSFDSLESIAKKYRTAHTKVRGGNTALYYFYAGLATSGVRDELNSSIPTDEKRANLEAWLAKKPRSLTARIALAAFWIGRGWETRGTSVARRLTESQVDGFATALSTAAKYLDKLDASTDPEIYYLTIQIGMGTSAPRHRLDRLYDSAIAAHPDFFQLYSQQANILDEKWFGKPGDIQKLAMSVHTNPGGEDGKVAYSFIAARLLECNCNDIFESFGLIWSDVQAGYGLRSEKYGLRNRDWNALCFLAALAGEREEAQKALDHIGPNWDPTVWKTKGTFDEAVKWIKNTPGSR